MRIKLSLNILIIFTRTQMSPIDQETIKISEIYFKDYTKLDLGFKIVIEKMGLKPRCSTTAFLILGKKLA